MTRPGTIRLLSATTTLLAVAALAAAIDHFGLPELFNRPLPCLVFSTTVIGFVISLMCLFAPASRLQASTRQLAMLAAPELDREVDAESPDKPLSSKLLLAYGFTAFILIASRFYALHQTGTHSDPAAFLRFAGEVKDFGGPWELLTRLYSGEYTQANQHPLLIGLLALHPTLTFAKTISLVAGCLTLLLVLVHVLKKYGIWPAGLALTLLATNSALVYFAALPTCESILILIITMVWVLLDQQDQNIQAGRSPVQDRGWSKQGIWFLIGGLLGLAYLTKGTAPVFMVGVAAGCLAKQLHATGQQPLKTRFLRTIVPLLVLLAGWTVVAHPLMIRNVKVYGNPLYSANQVFFYRDSFPSGPDPFGQVAAAGTLSEIRNEYLATHTVTDIAQRELTGIGWQCYIFVRSLGPTPLDDSRVLFGILFSVLAGLVLLHTSAMLKTTVAVWLILSLLVFGWYIPIAAGQRFMAPMLPMLLGYTGIGIWRVLHHVPRLRRGQATVLIGFAWTALWLIWTTVTIWPKAAGN